MKLRITAPAVAGGKIHKKGDIVDVPRQLAEHLVENKLAEQHREEPPPDPTRDERERIERERIEQQQRTQQQQQRPQSPQQ
jgi:hypothetical protein